MSLNNDMDGLLAQFRINGVPDPKLPLTVGMKKVTYGPQKKAWYRIGEHRAKNGRTYYHGTYGFKGQHWKIEYDAPELTAEDWAALNAAREKAERDELQKRAEVAALAAQRAAEQWRRATEDRVSQHGYILRKQIAPERARLLTDRGWEGWLALPLTRFGESGLVGLQKIADRKPVDGAEKLFNKGMAKEGACLVLGDIIPGQPIVLVEGYATGGSVRAGVDYSVPVVVALDAGNLRHVAVAVRGAHPDCPLLFAADDDYLTGDKGRHCAEEAARMAGNAAVVLPRFDVPRAAERGAAAPVLTDFNDLQVHQGLDSVREQIRQALLPLLALGPAADDTPAPPVVEASPESAVVADTGGAGSGELDTLRRDYAVIFGTRKVFDIRQKEVMTLAAMKLAYGDRLVDEWLDLPPGQRRVMKQDEVASLKGEKGGQPGGLAGVLERYVYLDGSDNVFDLVLYEQIPASAMKMATGEMFKFWMNAPTRRVVPLRNVVFDPTQRQLQDNHINLFRGLSMKPTAEHAKAGPILDLIAHLCNGDYEDYMWLLRWMAYPLQHVGAKMATAVIMHSSVHGSGKSLLWEECYKPIFGEYGVTVSQHQLESPYTGWRSRRLFALGEELLSNNQRFAHTGALKQMVTGKTQQIERKFRDALEESNHVNLVFLSNELQPFNVENHDRRYMVIWPQNPLPPAMQQAVEQALADGAVAAFYGYLLGVPLEGFNAHTKPPMNAAKRQVIEVGLPSWHRFLNEWRLGLEGDLAVPFVPTLVDELYAIYEKWCARYGEKTVMSQHKFSHYLSAEMGAGSRLKRWVRIQGEKFQRTVFEPVKCPSGQCIEDWLGEQVVQFRGAAIAAGWEREGM